MLRLLHALMNSYSGLKLAFKDEAAFRQDVLLALVLAPLALWLAPDALSLALMLFSLVLVLITELLNTGIEAAIDRIGTKRHPLSKKAKDTASAAVLLSLVGVALVWGTILLNAYF